MPPERVAGNPIDWYPADTWSLSVQADTILESGHGVGRVIAAGGNECPHLAAEFFGGMSLEDTAAVLGVSPRTVKRDWTVARTWLRRAMQRTLGSDD